MAKFCSQCGTMMEDAQVFCGVCGTKFVDPTSQQAAPQYSAPQQAAPQQAAPQYSAPQQSAPQQVAPQYRAPQQSAPQYGAPQYGAPQYGAPQYGAPQYNAVPKESAFAKFFANLDWMGMLTGKAAMLQNCLAALAVQFLSFIFFFLPMLSIKVGGYGYAVKSSVGLFKAFSGAGVIFPVLALLALLGSVAFLLLPLFQKKEIKPLNVLVFFAGQAVYFLTVVISVIVKMISGSNSMKMFGYSIKASCGITVWFIFFALFTLGAMFLVGRILYFRKDEVMAIFKKQPANTYANNAYVNNGVPNNYVNNPGVNNYVNNNPNGYMNNNNQN